MSERLRAALEAEGLSPDRVAYWLDFWKRIERMYGVHCPDCGRQTKNVAHGKAFCIICGDEFSVGR